MTTIDPRDLRQAFGRFMTGVTIVTTVDPQGTPVGFTANSFSSVSLDPPMLLVCPGKFLSTFDHFASCDYFGVSVLAEGQEEISNTFASFKGDRFARSPYRLAANGVPLIDGAVAQFSCKTRELVDAGDHGILLGQVETYNHRDGPGLGYSNGRYFSIGLERKAFETTQAPTLAGAIIEHESKVYLEATSEGLRPPQIEIQDQSQLRGLLRSHLATAGYATQLGAAYSVFDSGQAHFVYILASLAEPPSRAGRLTAVPLNALADATFATPSITSMMSRFATESRQGDFSLYLGTAETGDVHRFSERT